MTMMPECILAKELGIPYATTALVTDYDCWKEEEQVTASSVMQVFAANVEKAKKLFVEAVGEIGKVDWSDEIRKMKVNCRAAAYNQPSVLH
uniref:PNP_UDP_1 domain-containing protein n=1 Tax=Caenorhabditis japonica TaxID=281687 RepID=A0A8R1IUP2_CAEJA